MITNKEFRQFIDENGQIVDFDMCTEKFEALINALPHTIAARLISSETVYFTIDELENLKIVETFVDSIKVGRDEVKVNTASQKLNSQLAAFLNSQLNKHLAQAIEGFFETNKVIQQSLLDKLPPQIKRDSIKKDFLQSVVAHVEKRLPINEECAKSIRLFIDNISPGIVSSLDVSADTLAQTQGNLTDQFKQSFNPIVDDLVPVIFRKSETSDFINQQVQLYSKEIIKALIILLRQFRVEVMRQDWEKVKSNFSVVAIDRTINKLSLTFYNKIQVNIKLVATFTFSVGASLGVYFLYQPEIPTDVKSLSDRIEALELKHVREIDTLNARVDYLYRLHVKKERNTTPEGTTINTTNTLIFNGPFGPVKIIADTFPDKDKKRSTTFFHLPFQVGESELDQHASWFINDYLEDTFNSNHKGDHQVFELSDISEITVYGHTDLIPARKDANYDYPKSEGEGVCFNHNPRYESNENQCLGLVRAVKVAEEVERYIKSHQYVFEKGSEQIKVGREYHSHFTLGKCEAFLGDEFITKLNLFAKLEQVQGLLIDNEYPLDVKSESKIDFYRDRNYILPKIINKEKSIDGKWAVNSKWVKTFKPFRAVVMVINYK